MAFVIALPVQSQDKQLLKTTRAAITFVSDAPLERITATNKRASGLIDPVARSFAVQVPIVDFEGFNSPLQKEHFNENYLASANWPNASFQGRIIETMDLSAPGTQEVRAKGVLRIHGVDRERIVPCRVVVADGGVRVTCTFPVSLEEHGIRVPRVVQQKIASVVQVTVDLLFTERMAP